MFDAHLLKKFDEKISLRRDDFAIPELLSSFPKKIAIVMISSQSSYEISIASLVYSSILEKDTVYNCHDCILEMIHVLSFSDQTLSFFLIFSTYAF